MIVEIDIHVELIEWNQYFFLSLHLLETLFKNKYFFKKNLNYIKHKNNYRRIRLISSKK
jgi:hypothetical protein